MLDNLHNAGRMAFSTMNKLSGKPQDKQARLYKNLPPDAFPEIVDAVGLDKAIDYVHAMEAKLVKEEQDGR